MQVLIVNGVKVSEVQVRERLSQLEKKHQDLTRDLTTMISQHLSDWNALGSALSVGQMLKDEEGISDRIILIEHDIRLVEDLLNDRNLEAHDLSVKAWKELEAQAELSVRRNEETVNVARKRLLECRQFIADQGRLREIIIRGVDGISDAAE